MKSLKRGRRPPSSINLNDPKEILEYLRSLAKKLGKNTLSTKEVNADSQINVNTIIRRFGSFSEALIQAGLKPLRNRKRNPDEMLMQLGQLIEELGREPSKTEVSQNLSYTANNFEKEFGSFQNACKLASEKEFIPKSKIQAPTPKLRQSVNLTKSRRRYGPTIDFRGLRHAPINELGVVFLFGMLAEDLGFVVESIQSGFPDCDAKLRKEDGSFEGVRIEFEYMSSSFEKHGHNSDGCDVIVCWEDDWIDCPVDVIELKEIIHEPSIAALNK